MYAPRLLQRSVWSIPGVVHTGDNANTLWSALVGTLRPQEGEFNPHPSQTPLFLLYRCSHSRYCGCCLPYFPEQQQYYSPSATCSATMSYATHECVVFAQPLLWMLPAVFSGAAAIYYSPSATCSATMSYATYECVKQLSH